MNALDLVRQELEQLDTPAGFRARVVELRTRRPHLSEHAAMREVAIRRESLRRRLRQETQAECDAALAAVALTKQWANDNKDVLAPPLRSQLTDILRS